MFKFFKVPIIVAAILTTLFVASCKKQYYFDTGLNIAKYDGNMMQYFDANPRLFDTLAMVIRYAGMEKYFTDSTITFFAPADSSIVKTYNYINSNFRAAGMDTLQSFAGLTPEFWRNILKQYMFRGKKGLEDYPQLDFDNLYSFSGEYVTNIAGNVMNIGTVFSDARGLKYKGYRRLYLNYVPTEASPLQNWIQGPVASCNIEPTNGYIHVLVYPTHYFGFDPYQTWLQARYYKTAL